MPLDNIQKGEDGHFRRAVGFYKKDLSCLKPTNRCNGSIIGTNMQSFNRFVVYKIIQFIEQQHSL